MCLLIVVYLTEIHDDALMNLLPQVSPEDLNEGDLEGWDLAVHEDSSQVQLHLETYVHLQETSRERDTIKNDCKSFITVSGKMIMVIMTYIGSVDGGGPPECETSIRDLIQTRPLGIGQLLPFHGFLKTTGLLPVTYNTVF